MTPAQRHRARIDAARATGDRIEPAQMGGHTSPAPARTPASAHAARTAAAATASASVAQTPADSPSAAGATDPVAAQMALRLTHDLRRLKEIKSVAHKVEAKRQMLPEYTDWIKGLIAADAGVGTGTAAEIAPTIMVWCIDIAEYHDALALADFLMRHTVPMPARYNRDLPSVIVEEIADAALKEQAAGNGFDCAILKRVEEMTDGIDMHDEIRAKLMKAIGTESLRLVEETEASAALRGEITQTLETLRKAQSLHDRVGVKDKIKRAEKLLSSNLAAFPSETDEMDKPPAS